MIQSVQQCLRIGLVAGAVLLTGCDSFSSDDSSPTEPPVRAGGQTTVESATANAFTFPAPNLTGSAVDKHAAGDAEFEATFVSAPAAVNGGVGPIFSNTSCEACHPANGRSQQVLAHISAPGADARGVPQPVQGFGTTLEERAIFGHENEADLNVAYRDSTVRLSGGETVTLRVPSYRVEDAYRPFPSDAQVSPRAALPVIGLGLLEAVPASVLRRWADEQARDDDAVDGEVNEVWNQAQEEMQVGRFGWKALAPTLRKQTSAAYHLDMGVTTPRRPTESGAGQPPHEEADSLNNDPEVTAETVSQATFYVQSLGVPARRDAEDPAVRRGEEIFSNVGCATCHRPVAESGRLEGVPSVSNQQFAPYTDLLLHDMGPALADGRPVFDASGREWRTPPLWGLGLRELIQGHNTLLHDGRARSIREAILWHGGEARPARERFRTKLSGDERDALVAFLRSL
ncbi:di-heme oxidoredictase family protein [Salinibacter altiplanensis]|uniref:di-heme oxidoreductase family protein n=1 Tax=Salinibacter altiplanensis TaxID=1803181 RepID=UPI001F28773B|nr:di-heme oxidoredictase family protein [Salinibacter altiplanensis]